MIQVNISEYETEYKRLPIGEGIWNFSIGNVSYQISGNYNDIKRRMLFIADDLGINNIILRK